MSAIGLGALTLRLGADTAGLQTDMGRAARIIQQRSAEMTKAFGAIKNTIAGLGVGLTAGAFGSWIQGALSAQDKADELAQKIGLTTEAVSKLSVAAKFSATDLEGVSKAVVKLSQNASGAAAGVKNNAAAFGAIGVSVTNAAGQIKSGDQLIAEIADKFATYRDSAEKTALAIGLFGKAGADMIPMLNEGSAALADWAKMAEQFGLVVSSATGKASAELADNSDKIMFAVQGLANTIAAELAPALAEMSRNVVTWLRSDEWQKWIATVRTGARFVADHLDQIVGGVRVLGEVAVIYIGGKLVTSLLAATVNVALLTVAAVRNAAAAGTMAAAWAAAGGNIVASTGASLKAIGAIPALMGVATAAIAGWQIGTYLRDQFIEARLFGIALVEGILVGWERIKQGAELMWAAVKFGFNAVSDTVKVGIASIVTTYAGALEKLPSSFGEGLAQDLRAYAASITPATNAAYRFKLEMIGINAETANAIAQIRKQTGEMAAYEFAAQAAADAIKKLDGTLDGVEAKFAGKLTKGTKEYADVVKQIQAAGEQAVRTGAAQADVEKRVAEAITNVGTAAKGTAPNLKDFAASEETAAKSAEKLAAAQQKMRDLIGNLMGALGPVATAWEKYNKAERDARDLTEEIIRLKGDEATAHRELVMAIELATRARETELVAIEKQGDVLGRYLAQATKERALLGLSDRQKAIAAAVDAATKEWKDNAAAMVVNQQTLREVQDGVAKSAAALYDQTRAIETATAASRKYGEIVQGAMESAIDATAEWAVNGFKDADKFWDSMVNTAKRAIAQLLAEWAKTKIIGAFSSNGGAGFWSSLLSGAASFFGGDSSDKPVQGFLQRYGASAGGTTASSGAASGAPAWFTSAAGSVASNASWLGPAGGITGAIAGAYYGSQQGDGGIGSAGATVAGAIAGYYAGTVAMSAFIGASAGAATGVAGAAATGAIGGASGAVAAIPIVGWVAAIALIVDKVTGGAIFGSEYAPNELHENVTFGADGVTAAAILNEWKYVSQGSQFLGRIFTGGALLPSDWKDMKFRNREIDVPPEMIEALMKIFEALGKTAKAAAKKLQTDVVQMMDAAFETVTYYDRDGKVERTETVGTILGKQYKEDWKQFQTRMHAELLVATLQQLDTNANAIAEAYRKNADELMDAAQTMVQVQADLQAGKHLLGGGDNLSSVFAWVEENRQGGEQLAQTYTRLFQATEQYNSILERVDEAMKQLANSGSAIDQMRAALAGIDKNLQDNIAALNAAAQAAGLAGAAEADLAKIRELAMAQILKIQRDFAAGIDAQIAALSVVNTPSGDFAAAMNQIWRSLQENVVQANLVARAAGQQGASEQQLARIHELAARQAAQAIAKLLDIAKQQARSLGYLGPQNLAEMDARIAELQGRADAATQAVNNFGSAMSEVAQQASAAIALLLGNLSPLNDQQKLQVALQGLYSGAVSQEQVLEIGRRLYASSQAYTDLFNQVMAVRPRVGGGGGSGGSRGGGNEAKPLTAAEAAELLRLQQQRPEQLRRERVAEAEEFARTIATLAAANGESFEDVADRIGIDLDQLGKDLGYSREDLLKYLSGIDVSQDNLAETFTAGIDRLIAAMSRWWGGGTGSERDFIGPRSPGVPVEDITRELRAGREEAQRERLAVVAATNRNTDAVRDLVAVTVEEKNRSTERNVREGWGGGRR